MTKEELLSEGFLVAYMTGELDDSRSREVASYVQTDAEVRHEYYDLQKTLEVLSFHYSISPRTTVKQFLMEDPSVMESARPAERSGGMKLLIAASVIITLLSTLTAFYFWQEWRSADKRLTELMSRNLQLAESYHIVNQELTEIRDDLAVLVSPEFSRIILDGTENAPGAKAVVYWSASREELFLNSANLEVLPQDQQYQLWALIDGKPVDAGVFDAEVGTFQLMKGVSQADAFAVTIEPSGGSVSPTLETMQVFGKNPDLG